ncbi:MAG: hypothetical protein JXQ27_04555 [Acidobacteria bacterium]|nr:hypothetical protein [Acidobacteriota bacterium]
MTKRPLLLAGILCLGMILPVPAATSGEAVAPEVISLMGDSYFAIPAEGEALAALQQDLAAAAAAFADGEPTAEEYAMLGRRLAYLWRYHEAIAVYSRGMRNFPDAAMLYRHRGHRYISVRKFRLAATDLARAADLKKDDFDIWYHLGLARYLLGDYDDAWDAYQRCMTTVTDDDGRVAVSYWLALTGFRRQRPAEINAVLGTIRPDMQVGENEAYYRLLRLFKGDFTPAAVQAWAADSALNTNTCGYGMAAWHLFNGRTDEARKLLTDIIADPRYWPAFGFIAAEADLARRQPADVALPTAREEIPTDQWHDAANRLLRRWVTAWNAYDLDRAAALFHSGADLTYISSEKAGILQGWPAVRELHAGFGFVPGGADRLSRLWVDDTTLHLCGTAVVVAGRWHFRRADPAAPPQAGPFSLVLAPGEGRLLIGHAHFDNDPAAENVE